MTELAFDNFILIALIVGVVIFFAVFIILCFRKRKELKSEQQNNSDIEKMFIEPESVTTTVRVTVVDMACRAKMVGTKTPRAVREFTVLFETPDREILKINVPEEMYDGFDKGQTGILTLADGDIYSFELE